MGAITGNRHAGYSLYELIVTLGIASVVFGLGLPAFDGFVGDKRLRAETDALFHAAHLARQESIVRRRVVSLCPSVDGEYCDSAARWAAGGVLFVNESRAAREERDPGEPLLMRHEVGENVEIRANRKQFSFRSTELRATNGTLIVCDPSQRAEARAIVVNYLGRPRVAYRNRRGEAYECAH